MEWFTDAEKRYVLGEMIKASHIDLRVLIDFAVHHGVQPNWLQMQLPSGRNMNQCIHAVETMFNTQFQPPVLSLKRRSIDEVVDSAPKRQAIMAPVVEAATYASIVRGGYGIQPINTAQPRDIQPRPAPSGFAPSPATSSPTVSVSTPSSATIPGRKRGRPSKADKEAWARANGTHQSTGYAPISPAPLAPLPAACQLTYSPSPGPTATYQISSRSSTSELRPRTKGATAVPQKSHHQQLTSESVPRSVQCAATDVDAVARRDAVAPGDGYGAWQDSTRRQDPRQSVPALLEPPLQSPQYPARSPPPLVLAAGIAARESIPPGIDYVRKEEHHQVANQA